MRKIILLIICVFFWGSVNAKSKNDGYIANIETTKFSTLFLATPDPIVSDQTFCDGATVADLVATGTTIQWYANSSGGTALPTSTVLTSNTYYATQTISGVESNRVPAVITINPNTTPTFSPVLPICEGGLLSPLPTTSNNGYTGTWSPALNNTATTTYTFTPDAGQCATTATLTITVAKVTFSAITTTSTCLNTNATITMNGLVPNSVSEVSYKLNGVLQTKITVSADSSGVGTFPVLFTVEGLEVEIVSVKRTDVVPISCVLITNYYGNSVILIKNDYCTQVEASQCATTLSAIDAYVYADLVGVAEGYRWKVTTLTGSNAGQIQYFDSFLRNLKITWLVNYAFQTQYKIEVSTLKGGVWQPYGTACNISTPTAKTQLSNCNQSISKMGDYIYADLVPFATGYRFRVTNIANPLDTQTIDMFLRNFKMSSLVGIQYNAIYNVEVAVKNTDGTFMSYGPICTVKTPNFPIVQIQESQCDYVVPLVSTLIYSETFVDAQQYRFLMTEGAYSQTYTSSNSSDNYFKLTNFTGLTPGTSYNIQVALKISNIWGPYGKVCRVTVP